MDVKTNKVNEINCEVWIPKDEILEMIKNALAEKYPNSTEWHINGQKVHVSGFDDKFERYEKPGLRLRWTVKKAI